MRDIREVSAQVEKMAVWLKQIDNEVSKVIVGQKQLVTRVVIAILSGGHALIEGVPGLAKTLVVKTIADCLQCDFRRVQFTPDLLPADIIGTLIYNPQEGNFVTKKGPVFTNILLADEINRAPAKVQSALLEAMQERQVTIGDTTYQLPSPFIVLATQNPIEQEGTYPLPEAQMDRFMFKLKVGYPAKEEEILILDRMSGWDIPEVERIILPEQVVEMQKLVREIYMDEKVKRYIVDIVDATRRPRVYNLEKLDSYISYGASPRATISLAIASRALAFLRGRAFVLPEDVKAIALDVLRHRVVVSYEAEAEGIDSDEIIMRILREVQVP